jgi:hypothetical protein
MNESNEQTHYVLFIDAEDSTVNRASPNAVIYPNLGLLTLMTALRPRLDSRYTLGYFDASVYSTSALEDFIDRNARRIVAMCFTVLTSNYGASVALAERAKRINPAVITVMGNDHFSALYDRVLARRSVIDYGFYGNDVVEGFTNFLVDTLSGRRDQLTRYPGLVFRDNTGTIRRNPEDPTEYGRLPLVNYRFTDSLFPHQKHYLAGQRKTYFFMRDRELRSQVVDIGRGCVKFAGRRLEGIPLNACDFCGIVPGSKEIVSPEANRAWDILRNVFEQGFNYFYITADELPLTLWPLLREMSKSIPEWFHDLSKDEKPSMFGYARAEAFATAPDRIEVLVNTLRMDHFFIGFDGLSDISLRVMNKQAIGGRGRKQSPMEHNLCALDDVVQRGGMITAGVVLTHLGITPEIMAENYRVLVDIVDNYPRSFAALDFLPLCPIPGSQSFRYLTHPEYAEARAAQFGLSVDRAYLESRKMFYQEADEFDMNELINDFTRGCCPDVTNGLVDDYSARIAELADRHGIVIGGPV